MLAAPVVNAPILAAAVMAAPVMVDLILADGNVWAAGVALGGRTGAVPGKAARPAGLVLAVPCEVRPGDLVIRLVPVRRVRLGLVWAGPARVGLVIPAVDIPVTDVLRGCGRDGLDPQAQPSAGRPTLGGAGQPLGPAPGRGRPRTRDRGRG